MKSCLKRSPASTSSLPHPTSSSSYSSYPNSHPPSGFYSSSSWSPSHLQPYPSNSSSSSSTQSLGGPGTRPSCTRTVSFRESREDEVHIADDWDRSPVDITPRLSYEDILELKQMQVEAARQQARVHGSSSRYLPKVPLAIVPLLPTTSSSSSTPPPPRQPNVLQQPGLLLQQQQRIPSPSAVGLALSKKCICKMLSADSGGCTRSERCALHGGLGGNSGSGLGRRNRERSLSPTSKRGGQQTSAAIPMQIQRKPRNEILTPPQTPPRTSPRSSPSRLPPSSLHTQSPVKVEPRPLIESTSSVSSPPSRIRNKVFNFKPLLDMTPHESVWEECNSCRGVYDKNLSPRCTGPPQGSSLSSSSSFEEGSQLRSQPHSRQQHQYHGLITPPLSASPSSSQLNLSQHNPNLSGDKEHTLGRYFADFSIVGIHSSSLGLERKFGFSFGSDDGDGGSEVSSGSEESESESESGGGEERMDVDNDASEDEDEESEEEESDEEMDWRAKERKSKKGFATFTLNPYSTSTSSSSSISNSSANSNTNSNTNSPRTSSLDLSLFSNFSSNGARKDDGGFNTATNTPTPTQFQQNPSMKRRQINLPRFPVACAPIVPVSESSGVPSAVSTTGVGSTKEQTKEQNMNQTTNRTGTRSQFPRVLLA